MTLEGSVTRVYGIVIAMYYKEHPPPHFHAIYGEFEITVNIKTGVVKGEFPGNRLKYVTEWYAKNKDSLRKNWKKSRKNKPLDKIKGLE
jgi:hypothetical protein